MTTSDIVQKLWRLCDVLRDDGITYHQYVTELTFLLFLKMAKETGTEKHLPAGYRWGELEGKDGVDQLNFYREMLLHLGSKGSRRVQEIYANAQTSLKVPRNLKKLVDAIDELDWYSAKSEGLLEKNAGEKKSGAGQYFTPRPLIDAMVAVIKPAPGERVQDPAAGTCGFLIAADRYIKAQTDGNFSLPNAQQEFQRKHAFYGVELVPDAHRLALMNLMLHDIEGDLLLGDTLSPLGAGLPRANVVLTNPPFGTKKGGGKPTRDDLTFETSNKQLAFVQHVVRSLLPGGRAAVVLPDNVLFEENTGTLVRQDLMDKCDLHTVLRLPRGTFTPYSAGVKANVVFFTRGQPTERVWIYDGRTNVQSVTKKDRPLTDKQFEEFERCYGKDPSGRAKRKSADSPEDRWRSFAIAEVKERDFKLGGFKWLKEDSLDDSDELPEPEEMITDAISELEEAVGELNQVLRLLEGAAEPAVEVAG